MPGNYALQHAHRQKFPPLHRPETRKHTWRRTLCRCRCSVRGSHDALGGHKASSSHSGILKWQGEQSRAWRKGWQARLTLSVLTGQIEQMTERWTSVFRAMADLGVMIPPPPAQTPTVCSERPGILCSEAYNLLDSHSAKSEFSWLCSHLQDRTSHTGHSSS